MDWLEATIEEKVQKPVRCSAYFCILDDDEGAEYVYDNHVLPAASLIKIPIMVEVFRQRREGKLNCSHPLTIQNPVEGGSFYELPPDTKVTIRDLLRHMIVESDNTCANMLIDILGMDAINETIQMLSLEHTVLRRKMMDFAAARQGRENTTSVSEMGRLFGLLASGQCLESRRDEAMRLILSQQEDNCILPAQIPNNVRVEHKTGELDGVYHDCGIVYKPGHPYICCIMTEGFTDEPQALYDLSYVARDIYDEV